MTKEEIVAAINAHGQWKIRLEKAIETGTSDANPAVARTDNQCAFGKWLYGSITPKEKSSPFYNEVKELHAKFHHAAANVLELALLGKKDEAREAMGPASDYLKTSSKLITTLSRWKNSMTE